MEEVRSPPSDTITIIHYNDVYNIEPRPTEPVGGAARFATAVKAYSHLDPLILFSGGVFSPSRSKQCIYKGCD